MQLSTAVNTTMTSREIAELTGKQHVHVMRDIEVMLGQLNEPADGYIQNWIHPQNGQEYRGYALDREHTECLVTGYSAMLRMKVIKRLRELESSSSLPTDYLSALKALTVEVEQRQVLENQLANSNCCRGSRA
ncbi:Rha family transcriptional regulator, partial [Pantoea rwandensis]|uniref:Rha family transcriptional regulator n=1 Tax=Pantoea rwandensis TaxID=1076550 RepID=UPI00056DF041